MRTNKFYLKMLAAVFLGVIATGAFPPYSIVLCLFISLPALFLVLESTNSPKQAFWIGWCFGFGHFVTGLYWISNSLLVEAEKFAWMIPLAVSVLPAIVAIYIGLVAMLSFYVPVKGWKKILVFACIWCVAELLRGVLFTGFPWNLIGYAWSAHIEILQITSIIGVYGLGLLTVVLATMPACYFIEGKRIVPIILSFAVLVSIWFWGSIRLDKNPTEYTDKNVHLIQANIPQDQKWMDGKRIENFMKHISMTKESLSMDKGGSVGDNYVVWSETSMPFILEREPQALEVIKKTIPDDVTIFTGAIRVEDSQYKHNAWNSLYAIKGNGEILGHYDKTRLVPFGEFIPFRGVLPSFVQKITHGKGDFSEGVGAQTLKFEDILPFSPLICYEIIFPDYVVNKNSRPSWLLNVTNDGWFGISSGPYQHLAMSKFRSIEYGIPLVRVANTGVSVVVDGYGRVIATIPLDVVEVASVKIPSVVEETVYSSYRKLIVFPLIIMLLLPFFLALRKSGEA